MMGNKNLRLLKILLPVAGVCLMLYAFYEYRQANNEVGVQKHFLRESQEEYKTLTKRFDMLSNELKSAVQTTADLDKQLKLQKKDNLKLEKEKEELERQYQTEGVRRSNENDQLSKEKQQLVEEKEELKRERDRLSARVTSLTAEMAEQTESQGIKEQQLRDECNSKLSQQTGKVSSLSDDLATCNSDLKENHGLLSRCKQEMAERASRYQHSDNGMDRQSHAQDRYDNYRGAGDQYHSQRSYESDRHYRRGYDQLHEERYRDRRDQRHNQNDVRDERHVRQEVTPRHEEDQGQGHKAGHPHLDEKRKREIYRNLRRIVSNGEELTPKQRHAFKLLHAAYGGLTDESPPGGAAAGPVDEDADVKGHGEKVRAKREGEDAAAAPHGRVDNEYGGHVDKNEHGKKHEGNGAMSHQEEGNREGEKREGNHDNQVAQLPQVPVNNENNNNNEEEVKDLVYGEHQNENVVKDPKEPGGAGEDKAGGKDVENALKDGGDAAADRVGKNKDPVNDKNQDDGGPDQPLENPALERNDHKEVPHPPEEREEQQQQPVVDPPGPVGGNEDDEDAAAVENEREREMGEDEQNRVKQPVKHEEEMDDGKRAFLHDREVFEQERLKHLQKEPRRGLSKEKEEQIEAMEKELHNHEIPKKGHHREIR